MEKVNNIKCPKCGNIFSVESVLEQELSIRLRNEIEQEVQKKEKLLAEKEAEFQKSKTLQDQTIKAILAEKQKELESLLKQKLKEEMQLEVKRLSDENSEKNEKIKKLLLQETELKKQESILKEKAEQVEFEIQKRMLEESKKIREDAEKRANEKASLMLQFKDEELKQKQQDLDIVIHKRTREEIEKVRTQEQMKQAELQKQIDDQKKLVDEMKRKAEQGSMQIQGEVQELVLEDLLRESYPFDFVEEVAKGVKGADCIQNVRNNFGTTCGQIIYESKRTKTFTKEWTEKLKSNMLLQKADIPVLVTQILPQGLTHFGFYEGVWVCTFEEVKSLSFVLRDGLIKIHSAVSSQENKGDKMVMLYDFLRGNEFHQQVTTIVEGFSALKDNINREKAAMQRMWSEREKQIEKVTLSTIAMYGSIKGIAGNAIQSVQSLELPYNNEES